MTDNLHTQMPFDIFKLNFPKNQHQDQNNIFKIIFLKNSNILLIDTQKSYTLYEILSEIQITISSEGKFQDQLADNFEELFFEGKPLILYSVDDVIYLHDIKHNRKVASLQFRENKLAHSSIYEEQYKFKLVPVWNTGKYEILYVFLFWKVSTLYKSGNREIFFELRILTFEAKVNPVLAYKLSLLQELNDIDPNLFRQVYFQPHKDFPKPIKLQSQSFIDFTFAFEHPISYQTEGYHIEFTLHSFTGQTKRKMTINSIYNQLMKEVVPLKNRLLILTKHQSMNLEELHREQDEENIHEHHQQHHEVDENLNQRIKHAVNEFFREDFRYEEKINKNFMKQKFNHLFEFESFSTQDKHFEEDEMIDIYCISVEKNDIQENYETQGQTQKDTESIIKPQHLKLTKLYSSLPIKQVSTPLSLTPNLIDNFSRQLNYQKLLKLQGLQDDVKECKILAKSKESFQRLYYENIFTSDLNHSRKVNDLQTSKSQLMKITYAKSVLYMKMLDNVIKTNQSENTMLKTQNPSELNYKEKLENKMEAKEKIAPQESVYNSFKELVLSMLMK